MRDVKYKYWINLVLTTEGYVPVLWGQSEYAPRPFVVGSGNGLWAEVGEHGDVDREVQVVGWLYQDEVFKMITHRLKPVEIPPDAPIGTPRWKIVEIVR